VKKLRKANPAKRKKLQKKLETQTSLMMKHPKECCVCQEKFSRTPETVMEWKIVVREKRVRLTCPKCWDIISEAMEEHK
tara:strand:+ start:687 stop:923 length:237 start_codon:yes stop_codon:yes gene_type:complete